ncbi:MAG TPA: ATP/GTP-binding protein [Candidatus Thermoplasmatota archaeon]|nr:ATP/GTP-binding protein [Candidatus Thermoplasmatota archaeon]
MEEPVYIYVVGTAGSGKSRFTWALKRWMYEQGHEALVVNLDPGAEGLPYEPDVDIRDWIQLPQVMEEYELGPNGAQIMAADLLALRGPELKGIIDSFRPNYVILDTPGQIELFVFREAGKILMDFISPADRTLMAFVVDPFLSKTPSAFVSQLLLASTTQFRFQVPMINVMSKRDVLKGEDMERILGWAEAGDQLEDALYSHNPTRYNPALYNQLNTDVFRALQTMAPYTALTPVSSATLEGMEDVYARVQELFAGGEDLEKSRTKEEF